jgi:hypothetical protein
VLLAWGERGKALARIPRPFLKKHSQTELAFFARDGGEGVL